VALPYSRRFISGQTAGSPVVIDYLVPTGFVAVLRDVDIYNGTATAVVSAFIVSPGSPNIVMAALYFSAVNTSVMWRGRQVFPAGATIRVSSSTAGVSVSASGYLLRAT
jgi:secreted Zn-dependent insulinase-like peptidase